ncbi:non-ribosomal peptide synthetase [Merismopedia glauca]|uniref:Non-ribosomal peptide synthetase n=1 Tax=Merismopedia glauca CCAP 1448/3 TaxID=1296344 RepID=A0A2T1BZ97_9CYAN|nr:non-ribosomal peptide synthetase [Merismopedia glauca]PSB01237.1 non-ribosomal peptide synthetase [Merismopedia glauca CCAP 1448/3]
MTVPNSNRQGDAKSKIEDIYPLSPMQQGMLFHSVYAPNSGVYVEQISVEIAGNLDIQAFERAWQEISQRHPVLRTAFIWEGVNSPLQVVGKEVRLPFSFHDWQPISQQQQQGQIEILLKAERDRGFPLSKAPLMRLICIRLTENSYQFIWTHHHILLDGWSTSLLLNEVFSLYRANCQNIEINLAYPRPYRDYINWLSQQSLAAAESFWREKLQGFITPTKLPIDSQNPKSQNHNLKAKIALKTAIYSALQALTRQYQITLSTLLQAAWALLLSRYSGESDVVFGTTVSGRPATLSGAAEMVGLFINTLPVRANVDLAASLLPWLQEFQAQQAEIWQYEYTPLVQIQKWSDLPANTALFDSIVVFENFPFDPETERGDGNLTIKEVKVVEQTNYPLTLIVKPDRELELELLYLADRFTPNAIARMLQHFQTLLESIAGNPHQTLSQLSWITQEEREEINQWNNGAVTDISPDIQLHELFTAQVEKTPDEIAVVFADRQLTYRELDDRANLLAAHLQSWGIESDSLVGICVERSLEMAIGLLGVLKAGGAYVPLDPNYPQERISLILEETQTPVILTQRHLLAHLSQSSIHKVCLEELTNPAAGERRSSATSLQSLSNLAYVIYTSGSTGKPKGAMNTHLGICNRLLWMQDTYQLTTSDRVLQKTPFSFDVSVWEFFWTLTTGATLVIAKPEGHRDSGYLVELIKEKQITTVHFVPSMLEIFLEEAGIEECQSLKRVICSGEALSFALQERFFDRFPAVELHNLYGPTEAAIDVTFWQCHRRGARHCAHTSTVPIGRAIANTQIYILDRDLQPVPVGIPGELHIGGMGLACGYLNRPELTEEKFIPNPFSQETASKLYKTGDLARYGDDGSIEFLGRCDFQVKIRGFRVELGEIEAVLQQHPKVKQAIAALHENGRLIAYLTSYEGREEKDSPLLAAEGLGERSKSLRQFLQAKLPEYMVPSSFVFLEALPLTSNGKLDRHTLKNLEIPEKQTKLAAPPRNPTEETLVAIWSEILKLDSISIHDNFFELGGHSLLATQAVSKIRKVLQIDLPLHLLFEKPKIADLAPEIEKLQLDRPVDTAIALTPIARSVRRVSLSSVVDK